MIDVGLNDVRVRQRTSGGKRGLNGRAQIDADNLARSPTRGELRVPALPAASFEHNLVAEKLRRDWRDPAEELLRVFFIFLREVLPLPTETLGGGAFVTFDLFADSQNAGFHPLSETTMSTTRNAVPPP